MANALKTLFTEIADAIREKTGGTDKVPPKNFPAEIRSISGGGASDLVKYVTFMDETGTETLFVMPVLKGDTCKDPITTKDISAPTKESDVASHYTYYGWSLYKNSYENNMNALANVQEDRTVYARFTASPVYYTISFYDETELVHTEAVPYGGSSTYGYQKDGFAFDGWNPEPKNITGDMSCYAILTAVVEHSWESSKGAGYVATGCSLCVYNGELLLLGGGTSSSSYAKQVRKRGGSSTSWTQISDMTTPKPMNNAGNPLVIDNEIHVYGMKKGTATADPENQHYKWNGSEWAFVEEIPFSQSHSRTRFLYHNGVVHAIGYNTSAKQHWMNDGTGWTDISDLLPVITKGNSAVVYKNELHLISPYGDTDGHYVWNGNGWDSVENVSALSINDNSIMVEIEGTIHLFMGDNTSNYKLIDNVWTSFAAKPRGIYNGGFAMYQGRAHFYGYGQTDMQYLIW